MTRSEASWCGDAEFGPEPDDREVRLLVALGDEPLADLPGDVGLRPSDQAPGRDLADHAVGGLGGEAQERDLVGVLDHAQLAQDRSRPSSYVAVVAMAAWSRRTCSAIIVSDRPIRTDGRCVASSTSATIAYGSSVSSHVRISIAVRRPASAAPRSSRGDDDERVLTGRPARAWSAARAASPRTRSGSAGPSRRR